MCSCFQEEFDGTRYEITTGSKNIFVVWRKKNTSNVFINIFQLNQKRIMMSYKHSNTYT
ncbi:hypothetical protein MARI151_10711 [Maribacter litoralis]|uniref:Uncharacterized protein n=1 Tax=Maribacter litoralis TaxID=2059726 RepID=A0A653NIU6_9FLAO|nr:hypothetical protein MARI151_10711 [Maribacter litoralis]